MRRKHLLLAVPIEDYRRLEDEARREERLPDQQAIVMLRRALDKSEAEKQAEESNSQTIYFQSDRTTPSYIGPEPADVATQAAQRKVH